MWSNCCHWAQHLQSYAHLGDSLSYIHPILHIAVYDLVYKDSEKSSCQQSQAPVPFLRGLPALPPELWLQDQEGVPPLHSLEPCLQGQLHFWPIPDLHSGLPLDFDRHHSDLQTEPQSILAYSVNPQTAIIMHSLGLESWAGTCELCVPKKLPIAYRPEIPLLQLLWVGKEVQRCRTEELLF